MNRLDRHFNMEISSVMKDFTLKYPFNQFAEVCRLSGEFPPSDIDISYGGNCIYLTNTAIGYLHNNLGVDMEDISILRPKNGYNHYCLLFRLEGYQYFWDPSLNHYEQLQIPLSNSTVFAHSYPLGSNVELARNEDVITVCKKYPHKNSHSIEYDIGCSFSRLPISHHDTYSIFSNGVLRNSYSFFLNDSNNSSSVFSAKINNQDEWKFFYSGTEVPYGQVIAGQFDFFWKMIDITLETYDCYRSVQGIV